MASPDGSTFRVTEGYTGGFAKPSGVSVDDRGRIYVADAMNDRVVILDGATGATTGVLDGFYEPQSVHAAGGESMSPTRSTTGSPAMRGYSPAPVEDTADPQTTFTSPANKSSVTGSTVTLGGAASDDIGVVGVELAVKDKAGNRWWNPTTKSWGPFRRFPAELVGPGARARPGPPS